MECAEEEITLQEALEEQQILEDQSTAVLGASDPQNCSYAKGYMKRQALYACLTCNPKGAPFAQRGGVCLACSYNCHEGHELVELFTKRHFRCDCGNKKFPDNKCRLSPEKDELNTENVYSQNFDGLYCSCHRPYPETDPEIESADDAMIQCIICEDWHHSQHCLKYLNVPVEETIQEHDFELICGPCMGKLEFLAHYSDFAVKPVLPTAASSPQTFTENESKDQVSAEAHNSATERDSTIAVSNTVPLSSSSEGKVKEQVEESSLDSGVGSINSDLPLCPLLKNPKGTLQFSDVNGVAWKGQFRSNLCKCSTCLLMYKDLKISYLVDEEDTIEHYEALGKRNTEAAKQSAEESIEKQINELGHVGQLELIHGINDFKDRLSEFLKGHAENGTVIAKEHVTSFFAKVNGELSAKRRRLE